MKLLEAPSFLLLEERLTREVQRFLREHPFETLSLIVPNAPLVRRLWARLTQALGAVCGVRVQTLQGFVQTHLQSSAAFFENRFLPEEWIPWVLQRHVVREKHLPFPTDFPLSRGFFESLQNALVELKQACFSPDFLEAQAKARPAGDPAKARWLFLTQTWRRFEAWKKKARFLDREDLLELFLRFGSPGPNTWVYGFYDATELQSRVLWKGASEGLWFVPYEQENPAFVFAEPFVKRLEKKAQGVERLGFPSSPRLSALEHLQRTLFQRKTCRSVSPDGTVEIFRCADRRKEVQGIARWIRRSVREAGALEDHLVLHRAGDGYEERLANAFEHQGIPVQGAPGARLDRTCAGRLLRLGAEILRSSYQREKVFDFLMEPVLDFSGMGVPPERRRVELWHLLSRRLEVTEGLQSWRQALEQDPSSFSEEEDGGASGKLYRTAWRDFAVVWEKLLERLQSWESAKSYPDFLEGARRLLQTFLPEKERKTVEAFFEKEKVWSSLGLEGDFYFFFDVLEERMKRIFETPPGEKGVRIGDRMQMRGIFARIVVLPGLLEGLLPRPPQHDAWLPDAERRFLNRKAEKNGFLSLKRRIPEEERLLFYLAVASAEHRLILTFPEEAGHFGGPGVCSSFLYEVLEKLCGRRVRSWREADSWVKAAPPQDLLEDFSIPEGWWEAACRAQAGVREPLLAAALDRPFFWEGWRAVWNRQTRDVFTEYDGMLESREEKEFFPLSKEIKGSAGRLETFFRCPLRYFFRYELGLEEEEREEEIEPDPLAIGILAHRLLEKIVRRGCQEGWWRKERKLLQACFAEEWEKEKNAWEKTGGGFQAFRAWVLKNLERDIRLALNDLWEEEYWRPVEVEKFFEIEIKPLQEGDGKLRLSGKMDRLDEGKDGALRIVDYKTGKAVLHKDSLNGGRALQGALYLKAAFQLFPDRAIREAVYHYFTERGEYRKVVLSADAALQEKLETFIKIFYAWVRRGWFPALAVEKACGSCGYFTLCGPGASERARHKSDDPRVQEWKEWEKLS